MSNDELRKEMKSRDVKQWEIAEYLDIPESRFSRMMRHELAPEIALSAFDAVHSIANNRTKAKITGADPIVVNK